MTLSYEIITIILIAVAITLIVIGIVIRNRKKKIKIQVGKTYLINNIAKISTKRRRK